MGTDVSRVLVVPDSECDYSDGDDHYVIYEADDENMFESEIGDISSSEEFFDLSNNNYNNEASLDPDDNDVHIIENSKLHDEFSMTEIFRLPKTNDNVSKETNESNLIQLRPFSRRLRERTAIQKMPYSLDRLKHREFLKGFDISGFENIPINFNISRNCLEQNSQERYMEQSNLGFWSSDSSYDEFETYEIQAEPNVLTDSNDFLIPSDSIDVATGISEVDSSCIPNINFPEKQKENDTLSEESSENDEIVFRGRKLDLRNGYRGILPKVAWKKAINATKNSIQAKNKPNKRQNDDNSTLKGVAKKKFGNKLFDEETKILIDELGTSQERNSKHLEVLDSSNLDVDNHKEATPIDSELEKVSSDSNPSGLLSDNEPELPSIVFEKIDDEVFDISNTFQDTFVKGSKSDDLKFDFEFNKPVYSHYPSENGAIESNQGLIDKLLSHGNRIHLSKRGNFGRKKKSNQLSVPKTLDSKINIRYRYKKRSLSEVKSTSKTVRATKKNSRSYTVIKKANHLNGRRQQPIIEKLKNENHRNDIETKNVPKSGAEESSKKRQSKNFFGFFPNSNYELNRKADTFVTVVEATNNSYSFTGKSTKNGFDLDRNELLDASDKKNLYFVDQFLSIQSLFYGQNSNAPNLVKITLAGSQYILSRLSINEVPETLESIFTHIIEIGATQQEILSLSEKLMDFLLYLDDVNVFHKIEYFHKHFIAKVTTNIEKAKPIHFYQLSVCQVLLLEICKFSVTSLEQQMIIENQIMQNIVYFFKLLSVCSNNYTPETTEELQNAFHLLCLVVTKLTNSEEIWNYLKTEKFPPYICQVLIETFPIASASWEILKVDCNFTSMKEALNFVAYSSNKLDWKIDENILLTLNNAFKKRKYENFLEDHISVDQNLIYKNPYDKLSLNSLFNEYLNLLTHLNIKHATLEKLIPISQINPNLPFSIILNRINYLLVLAKSSKFNLEKRLESLFLSILNDQNFENLNKFTIEKIIAAMLNGYIGLIKIKLHGKNTFQLKAIYDIFIHIQKNLPGNNIVWSNFMKDLSESLESADTNIAHALKNLYRCFLEIQNEECMISNEIVFLEIFRRNSDQLGPEWIGNNLFKVIKSRINAGKNWIDYYCTFGKLLISSGSLSWWAFLTYNNLEYTVEKKIYFYHKIVKTFSGKVYDMIKKELFTTALELMFDNGSNSFYTFMSDLLYRETKLNISFINSESEQILLKFLKSLTSVLDRLSYTDLIIKLITIVHKKFEDKELSNNLMKQYLDFLNSRLIDKIRDNYEFVALKRKLGVSDVETERSIFRDAIKFSNDETASLRILLNGFVHACATTNEMENYMIKVVSLLCDSSMDNPVSIIVQIIEHQNLTGDARHDEASTICSSFFMKSITNFMSKKLFLYSRLEFFSLCRLHRILCQKYPLSALTDYNIFPPFNEEIIKFQTAMLRSSYGFLEYDFLKDLTNSFLNDTLTKSFDNKKEKPLMLFQLIKENVDIIIEKNKQYQSFDKYTYEELIKSLSSHA